MKMKWMPRLLAALLAMLMLLSIIPASLADALIEITPEEYLLYTDEAVQEYYEMIVCANGYTSAMTYKKLLTDGQFEEFYSRLTDEQKKALDGTIADMYAGYLYEPAVNRTNAAELREGPVVQQPKIRMMAASPAAADTEISFGDQYTYDNGMYLNKTAKANTDGSYTLTLETFLAGTVSATPSDIVLVLDDSGSMAYYMGMNPVYTLDTSKTYYVKFEEGSSGMRKVKWTKQTQVPKAEGSTEKYVLETEAWALQEVMGGEMLTTRQKSYLPKTSASDSASNHYQFYESCMTRTQALKNAVNTFLDAVEQDELDKFPVGGPTGHRVSIVRFANKSNTKIVWNWTTPRDFSGKSLSFNSNGATYIDEGLSKAIDQFNALATPKPADQARNKVVVVFTDGYPGGGDWSAANAHESASNAINNARTLKQKYKATVYAVGIFEGANTSVRYGGTLHQEADGSEGKTCTTKNPENDASNGHGLSDSALANTMMNTISSCYPNAESSYNTEGELCPSYPSTLQFYLNRPKADYKSGYYLSASDAGSLNKIFKNISSSIQKPVEYEIDEATKVVDELSAYFELISGASSVRTYTSAYQGNENWAKPEMINATVNVEGKTVSVKGFDFQENFVAEDPRDGGDRGKKLIIEIDVRPEGDFVGGNAVPTNQTAYVDRNGVRLAGKFPQPVADVATVDISVAAENRNVYLYDVPTGEELMPLPRYITFKDRYTNTQHKLDVDANGTEWRNDYVVVTDTVTKVTGVLSEDTTYTITVNMTPKNSAVSTDGNTSNNATAKTATATANIYVYKPTLTFKDATAYYDGAEPNYPAQDYVGVEWKHGKDVAVPANMMGSAPAVEITYTHDADVISSGKVNTKQDYHVNAAVKIAGIAADEHVTFAHQGCSTSGCSFNATKGEFLVHVNTCQLTVKKSGGNADEPYVIIVNRGGTKYTELTLKGGETATIYELPIGEYTIAEETDWSWRFNANNGSAVTLSSSNTSGTITCTNTANGKNQWLNDYDGAVVNTQGVNSNG